ncbi:MULTISPECIES: hypothetical protein [Kitasatospora]|uniref:HTH araC/xylS-type domain-containing protein n=1 Tax=Kitasatospora setae (strain ATCC 33774 / DSM 43861 / JCM 3304 / KCC A-0304 / NBRC 14216 / KM-6054) TaxID=452652 RepID=E4MYV7_KITSK|nr:MULTISPECIES: hypothetical protein [Kitasatospora]BAJ32763.1 hypothetical protein KSE_70060 [Kitasatospora setae KM-6054]
MRLHALLTDATGLPPKHFARIERLRAVLVADPGRWAAVVARTGYYDQSHPAAEFRRLMGVPSAAFSAGRHPVATRCTG